MVIPPTHGHDTGPLQRMINRARKAAKLTPREKLLYQLISSQASEALSMNPPSGHSPDEPPEEFVSILRMPAGEQHPLTVTIDGQEIRLVLNSRGAPDAERESYLWRWLLRRVRQETAQ